MTLLGIVCCVHNISDHCNVIGGWCVCDHLVAGGHPLGLTITLSSSAQSITINYHNSGDHWPPPLSPGSSAWSAVPSSAPSSPIWWWHISTHVRVWVLSWEAAVLFSRCVFIPIWQTVHVIFHVVACEWLHSLQYESIFSICLYKPNNGDYELKTMVGTRLPDTSPSPAQ